MFSSPTSCPNSACQYHAEPVAGWYAKKGYFRTKYNRQPVPKYRCKNCGVWFNSHTLTPSYRQHKPSVNAIIGRLLCSGVTMRRTAEIAGVSRRTVAKKLKYLAEVARAAHQEALKIDELTTEYVQFDEMETYETCKMLPLSIALAVRKKNGQIISAKVATMNCHGKTARASVAKYQRRIDTRRKAALEALREAGIVAKPKVIVATDAKAAYRGIIKAAIPHAVHVSHPSRRPPPNSKQHDPLFKLNVTCAKLRADIARLSRKTWSASKNAAGLQDALDIYIAFNNGYPIW